MAVIDRRLSIVLSGQLAAVAADRRISSKRESGDAGSSVPIYPLEFGLTDSSGHARLLCLSEIKLAHTDDEVRQEMA
jgi:hypothetical protein